MSADPAEDPRFAELKALQSARLWDTYRDFAEKPGYRATCDFFFGEVYHTEDTRRRDRAFESFYANISRVLGGDIVRCMRQVIDLQKLTVELDLLCVRALIDLDIAPGFDMQAYERAYRHMGERDRRERQIRMLVENLFLTHKIFRRFGIGVGLHALHKFHRLRGDDQVTGFLWRGYQALHRLSSVRPLAEAVERREMERLQRIFEKGANRS
ncbi:hypothetical protein SCOR_09365 [Sulfidibacter corallicola]|uniref:DUF8198 domain-containing protein n=1 Tax=Sulfidibacter corallicola TaxID=2818388 RepID=A0A8A4TNA3_SULCO|nr:hypothetical protein [Sulfidibacter corallicola]QTD51033.1 hypothetical protein J3U87_01070 [Sulfidibacter corallicola]